MEIKENISLTGLTTFRIGGPARYFAVVKTIDDLKQASNFAKEKHLPLLVLGGGSNVVVADEGFAGLVVKNEIKGIESRDLDNGTKEIVAGAGENWDEFVAYAVRQGLYGLENLSLIPGTVGAAPIQNIGAYGVEVKDTIGWVEVFDQRTHELKTVSNHECAFSYRDSFFKKPEGKHMIVTRVGFVLKSSGSLNISYKDLEKYVAEHRLNPAELSLEKVRNMVISIRTQKLPDLRECGTAGSFFKNPIITKSHYDSLLKKYPDLPAFPVADTDNVKISAAWILDKLCGLKGYRVGDVGTYKNQPLVIVNYGTATAAEIKKIASHLVECAKEKTGIELEREVQYV